MTSYCLENCEEIKDIQDCNNFFKKYNDKYKKCNDIFIKAFQLFRVLIDNVDNLISPMELTDEVLNTQIYDKVDGYKTLEHIFQNCRLEGYVDTHKNQYKMFFDFETITSEYKHMPYLCWVYNDDIQQEFIGNNTCSVDMLNALPTYKCEILPIAHNSDYDFRFILGYLQNVKPIEK